VVIVEPNISPSDKAQQWIIDMDSSSRQYFRLKSVAFPNRYLSLDYNINIGSYNKAVNGVNYGITLGGGGASPTISVMANFGIACGFKAVASTLSSIAIGSYSVANTGTYALAIGSSSQATAANAITIGSGTSSSSAANATAVDSIAIGRDSLANAANSIAIGESATTTAVNQLVINVSGASSPQSFTTTFSTGYIGADIQPISTLPDAEYLNITIDNVPYKIPLYS
jgi:hypothetical protein